MIAASPSAGRASRLDAYEKRLAVLAYVDEIASKRWQWGECDCTMAVATWIERATGVDPLAQFRGTYSTPDEARAVVKRAGGFGPTIGRLFDEMGLERTLTPECGDVGIINASIGLRHCMPVVGAIMAIRVGPMWMVKALRGLSGRTDFEPVVVWRL
jgi:hypothetical protein